MTNKKYKYIPTKVSTKELYETELGYPETWDVDIETTSRELWEQVYQEPWFVSLGTGINEYNLPCFYLYVKSSEMIKYKYHKGFPIIIRESGPINI